MVFWKNYVLIFVQNKTKTQRQLAGAQSIQYPLVGSKNVIPFWVE